MARKNPRRIGQYEVLGELGEGAMGKVYKAVQPSLNRVVAIKVLPAEFMGDEKRVERFDREAQAVALINHPNVVQIIDKDAEDDQLYFVMEYVPGTSLDALMQSRRLSLREALIVIKAVSKGLEAAHRKSVVHRDLNPRNILISDDLTTVKVADFGISRVESISRSQGTLSTSEVSMGTLHYIAPEQANDMVTADHRADIYSLGVLLYEMLTGRVPVGRFNLPSQLNTEVPAGIDSIVLKCLSADPDERYESASAFLTDVRKLEDRLRLGLAEDLQGISRSTGKILRRSTSTLTDGKRGKLPIAAGVALLLGSAIFAWWHLSRDRVESAPLETASTETRRAVEIHGIDRPTQDALNAGLEAPDFDGVEPPNAPEALSETEATPAEVAASPPEDPTEELATATIVAPAPSPAPSRLASELDVVREKYRAKLYGPARGDLEELIEKHPGDPKLAEVYLLRGQIEQSERMHDEALATYLETQTRYPRSSAAAEAQYRRARLTVELGGKDRLREGVKVAQELVESHPRSSWAPQALLLAGRTQSKLRLQTRDRELNLTVPTALQSYRQIVQSYPRAGATEEALWALGEIYEDLKQFELAADSFERLGRSFPTTKFDAWWRSARLYDRKLDDKTKALAAYQRVPNSSPQYSDARKRLSKLSG